MPSQQSALLKLLSSSGVSNVSGERFLPVESIKSLITPTNVTNHLSICFKSGWANKQVQEKVNASSEGKSELSHIRCKISWLTKHS